MATADEYAAWIVKNEAKRGTPEFATVAAAYEEAKREVMAPPAAAPAPRQEPGILDRIAGAGEAGLTVGTGTLGYLAGLVSGGNEAIKALLYGATGTQPAPGQMPDPSGAFAREQQALTYQPRTEAGRDALRAAEEAGQFFAPLAGMSGQVAQLSQAARQGAQTVAPAARAVAQQAAIEVPTAVSAAYKQTSDRITQAFGMSDDVSRRDGGSVGAAGTERALRLQETSQQLPVPIQLRKGELTGDIDQLRFETTQARGSMGEPLRAQAAQANRALSQNVEAVAEATGAETASNLEAGRVISKALAGGKARADAAERAAWQAADKSGAASEVVPVDNLAAFLRENAFARDRLPILTVIERKLKMMNAASGSLAGEDFTPGQITLKGLQEVRKSINKFVDESNGADIGAAKAMKRIIDDITEGVGDDLYREARQQTIRKEQLYGNNAVVRDLIKLRKGTTDRAVALEDVYKNTILQGSADDLTMLKRTLSVSDQHAGFKPGTDGPGAQAWRELQGATVRDLLKKATSNNGIDFEGGQAFSSAAYSRALRQMDENGKLRQILGPKQAQALRDIDEIARAIKVLPPGTVSSSGSAEALILAAGEAAITGVLTGVPAPVLTTLKLGAQAVKDRKTRARIMASLNYRPSSQATP